MAGAWILLIVALSMATIAMRRDPKSPLAWSLCLWVVVAVIHVTQPIPLAALNGTSTIVVCVGLIALTAPMIFSPANGARVSQGPRRAGLLRLSVWSIALTILMLVGLTSFQNAIAGVSGADFSNLTLYDIRLAQNGSARGGGLAVLLLSVAPIVACLGIYGAYRFSRLWLVFTGVAAYAVFQSPARTTTLSLIVTCAVFWLFARTHVSRDESPGESRPLPWLRLGVVAAGGLAYFVYIGDALSKSFALGGWLPGWAQTPVAYVAGGISALSVSIRDGFNPLSFGTSVYLPMRALESLGVGVVAPETIGAYVSIPMPFNVFSGFGQMYFDFGLAGVAVLSLVLGAVAWAAQRRSTGGMTEWALVSAIIAGLLFTLPQGFRLFNLDVAMQLAVGFAAFWSIRRGRASPTERGRAQKIAPRASRVSLKDRG